MAGFEVIVRPVVFPSIRPSPPRVLPPVNDPTQGFAVIGGSGGSLIDLTRTFSVSVSRQFAQTEEKRQFNKERVHQVDSKTGVINQDNYVEIERLKRVRLNTSDGAIKMEYADPPPSDNVKILETDVTRVAGS